MIKISKLVINRTLLEDKITKIKYLVAYINYEKSQARLQDPHQVEQIFDESELNERFTLYGIYDKVTLKKSVYKIVYTVNRGEPITQIFDWESNMMTYCASLIAKHQDGQKVEIKSFKGPMSLMKTVSNALMEDIL